MKQKAKPTAFRAEGLAFEVLCKEGKSEAGSSLADGCFRESAAFSGSALFSDFGWRFRPFALR
ncbi:MAG TPA: hypothetical protein DEV98_04080 [Clostridiales bacterium]|nr:hypothetical protein [Clostridiales bacterium]